jgi:hypothetical protein
MTTSRTLLIIFAALAVLAAVGTAAAAPRDNKEAAAKAGGALAEPYAAELKGGGNIAPSGARTAEAAAAGGEEGTAGAAPAPAPAPEQETATVPAGEQVAGGQDGAETAAAQASQSAESIADEELAPPVSGTDTGGLPSTGAELLAMATIGLGLLMLGAALRPSKRPRDGRQPRPSVDRSLR